ncbi:hypothetical protein MTR67_010419 [Solanum verrucosum]|uniref:BTB/POZ domain-containing protein n=1 Tax=Solanum verrucosum TaxID=315347 RepID=A0AAF0TFP7_SOLVR|nr:hypothetical protein MTR67_010419 [Solanum verrucosum]
MKRTSEWIFSQEIPSDVTVNAGGISFTQHKFPLVSKSGYIRKLVSESNEADISTIEIPDIPGGGEAFEFAAKFCYGINFEMSTENIALLRCVAEYLEMTDYAVANLIACKDNQFSTSGRAEAGFNGLTSSMFSNPKPIVDWWSEDLTVLRIDFFQRVLIAMMGRGFKQYALGPILMLYAQKFLRCLEIFEKRVVLETIVGLLPREKNALSVSFLSMLLRAAIYLQTTIACRLDLEKRMALQLGQAVLDDLLIPSYSFTGDTLFDVETMQRIMMNFLDHDMEENRLGDEESNESYSLRGMERVGKLMENYLAEIASDRNLSITSFINLAEVIPEQERITEDGMYRAIDIYFKAHPALSDMERKKVCGVMDCQKLSREACAHAAQNDRLPVQTVVQVLYYEQQLLRNVMDGSHLVATNPPVLVPSKMNHQFSTDPISDEVSSLKRENQELKFELLKMKTRLMEIEKPNSNR